MLARTSSSGKCHASMTRICHRCAGAPLLLQRTLAQDASSVPANRAAATKDAMAFASWMLPTVLFFAGGLSGCAAPIAVAITADRALTERGDVALGWSVEPDEVAHVVRWRECRSATECNAVTHERSGDLEAIDALGTTTVQMPDGPSTIVEVKRLHFAPPPPNRPTYETECRANGRC